MELQLNRITSPLGEMALVTDAQGTVRALDFTNRLTPVTRAPSQAAEKIAGKIEAYFKGDLDAPRGIAAGTTKTYRELARSLGFTDPRMAKEIGAAIGANPVALVVPCHRVIGKDGSLRGYAWGLPRKQWLLAHEKAF